MMQIPARTRNLLLQHGCYPRHVERLWNLSAEIVEAGRLKIRSLETQGTSHRSPASVEERYEKLIIHLECLDRPAAYYRAYREATNDEITSPIRYFAALTERHFRAGYVDDPNVDFGLCRLFQTNLRFIATVERHKPMAVTTEVPRRSLRRPIPSCLAEQLRLVTDREGMESVWNAVYLYVTTYRLRYSRLPETASAEDRFEENVDDLETFLITRHPHGDLRTELMDHVFSSYVELESFPSMVRFW